MNSVNISKFLSFYLNSETIIKVKQSSIPKFYSFIFLFHILKQVETLPMDKPLPIHLIPITFFLNPCPLCHAPPSF